MLDRAALALCERGVGVVLERHDLALAPPAVGGDQHLARGVVDASGERRRGEASEHHRVRGADARARQHRHRELGDHAEVDRDAVAAPHAEALQHVREPVHLVVQLAVADRALVLGGLADPDVGGLVAASGCQVTIEAVHRDVEDPVREPLVERRVGVVEPLGRRVDPLELLEGARLPPRRGVPVGVRVDLLVADARGCMKGCRRVE